MTTIQILKKRDDAIIPSKAHDTDIGYDLTAVEQIKSDSRLYMFDTGIVAVPPKGYYLKLVPRSSLCKTGYVLANSIGIIDPDYRGTIKIALYKVDDFKPLLQTPFTKVQIIVEKFTEAKMQVVDSIDETARGEGGFGSTDAYT